jgi:hypothetical protein
VVWIRGQQLVAKRHRASGATAVDQLPRSAARGDGPDHRNDRRDADAARDEDVLLSIDELEVIARALDSGQVALGELVVHMLRSAPACHLAQHSDFQLRSV